VKGKAQFLEAVPVGCLLSANGKPYYANQTTTDAGRESNQATAAQLNEFIKPIWRGRSSCTPLSSIIRALGESVTIDDIEIHQADNVGVSHPIFYLCHCLSKHQPTQRQKPVQFTKELALKMLLCSRQKMH